MPVCDDEGEREPPVGAEETSIWCMECMLPSACRWSLKKLGHPGMKDFEGRSTVVICEDCHQVLDDDGFAE